MRSGIYGQRGGRQTKHKNGKKASHKDSCIRVTGKKAFQVAVDNLSRGIGEFTKLKPNQGIENVVQNLRATIGG